MLGSREDGEDALQQAFLRAHRALAAGRTPEAVRPWLYAIARNRCLTILAARRESGVAVEDVDPGFDGLAEEVQRRADLRELVGDLARLPDDQREALVLAELGDLSHPEIANVIGCPPAKVKALVFQARSSLIADRDARATPCGEIRQLLESARGGVLRRGPLRRHLRHCNPCAAYRVAIEGRSSGLALVLPVAPTAGLKAAVLAGAGGLGGGAETAAAAAAALTAPGAVGAATSGGGGAAMAGGVAVKALAAKAGVAAALAVGAAGGGVAVEHAVHEPAARGAAVEQAARRVPAGRLAPAAVLGARRVASRAGHRARSRVGPRPARAGGATGAAGAAEQAARARRPAGDGRPRAPDRRTPGGPAPHPAAGGRAAAAGGARGRHPQARSPAPGASPGARGRRRSRGPRGRERPGAHSGARRDARAPAASATAPAAAPARRGTRAHAHAGRDAGPDGDTHRGAGGDLTVNPNSGGGSPATGPPARLMLRERAVSAAPPTPAS